jgi:glycosyltransferase involved in cell wall biosynthesis
MRFFTRRILPPEELYVLIATYNHEAYIAQAIEGALMQKVDLPLRIIIRDDASTDKTSALVGEYSSRFPDLITLILHKENQYSLGHRWVPEMAEMVRSSSRVSDWGNIYVALCEGDDYWTDPRKLQRQVDVLRRRPDVNLVHHATEVLEEPGGNSLYKEALTNYLQSFEPPRDWPETAYFAERHNVMTCSAMVRFSGFDFAEMATRPPGLVGDWILYFTLAKKHPPVFLKSAMSTYRIHGTSSHSSKSPADRVTSGEATRAYLRALVTGTQHSGR